jgi:hypothetical protein
MRAGRSFQLILTGMNSRRIVPIIDADAGMNEMIIRRMFEDEPGVLQWRSLEKRRKRGYQTPEMGDTLSRGSDLQP